MAPTRPTTDEFDERQRDMLAEDLARRLRPVCAHLSAPAFSALVSDLVAMKARFRAIEREKSFWFGVTANGPDDVVPQHDWPADAEVRRAAPRQADD